MCFLRILYSRGGQSQKSEVTRHTGTMGFSDDASFDVLASNLSLDSKAFHRKAYASQFAKFDQHTIALCCWRIYGERPKSRGEAIELGERVLLPKVQRFVDTRPTENC